MTHYVKWWVLFFYIYTMINLVCKNPWCKANFFIKESEIKEIRNKKIYPTQCKKCESFNNDLSAGVSWEEKKYEGNPWSGIQKIKYNITNYK